MAQPTKGGGEDSLRWAHTAEKLAKSRPQTTGAVIGRAWRTSTPPSAATTSSLTGFSVVPKAPTLLPLVGLRSSSAPGGQRARETRSEEGLRKADNSSAGQGSYHMEDWSQWISKYAGIKRCSSKLPNGSCTGMSTIMLVLEALTALLDLGWSVEPRGSMLRMLIAQVEEMLFRSETFPLPTLPSSPANVVEEAVELQVPVEDDCGSPVDDEVAPFDILAPLEGQEVDGGLEEEGPGRSLWRSATHKLRSRLHAVACDEQRLRQIDSTVQGAKYHIIWSYHGCTDAALFWVFKYWLFACLLTRDNIRMRLRSVEPAGQALLAPFVYWRVVLLNDKTARTTETLHSFRLEEARFTAEHKELLIHSADTAEDLSAALRTKAKLEEKLAEERSQCDAIRSKIKEDSPDLVRGIMSNVLNSVLLDGLQRSEAGIALAEWRLGVSELTVLLSPDEDVKRLHNLPPEMWVLRWLNHHAMKFKVLAAEIQDSGKMDRLQLSEDETLDIEWSAKDAERYRNWCRILRAMPKIANLDQDLLDGVALVALYASITSWLQQNRSLNPGHLWALDERDPELRLGRICEALHTLLPSQASRCLLQQMHVGSGSRLIMHCLAALFMHSPGLPLCLHEKQPWDFMNVSNNNIEAGGRTSPQVEAPTDMKQDFYSRRSTEVGSPTSPKIPMPFAEDRLAHGCARALQSLAGSCVTESLADYSSMLREEETLGDLMRLDVHQLLLRWVHVRLVAFEFPGVPHDELQAWSTLKEGSWRLLFGLLRSVASDIAPLKPGAEGEMGDRSRREALVEWVSRCTTYSIVSRDSLKSNKMDDVASFVAALFLSRPTLPAVVGSPLRFHVDVLQTALKTCTAISREMSGASMETMLSPSTRIGIWLQAHGEELQAALVAVEQMRQVHTAMESLVSSFLFELLAQRANGKGSNLARASATTDDASKQVIQPQRVWELVAGHGFAPDTSLLAESLLWEQNAEAKGLVNGVLEIVHSHAHLLDIIFRQYAEGQRSRDRRRDDSGLRVLREQRRRKSGPRHSLVGLHAPLAGSAPNGIVVGEGSQTLDLRGLMRIFREAGWRGLSIAPHQVEAAFMEVRQKVGASARTSGGHLRVLGGSMGHGITQLGFAEVVVIIALRALQLAQPTEKGVSEWLLEFMDRHIAVLADAAASENGLLFKDIFYDAGANMVLSMYEPALRATFTAYAEVDQRAELREPAPKPRTSSSTAETSSASASAGEVTSGSAEFLKPMSFQLLLNHAGLQGGRFDSIFPRIFRGLHRLEFGQVEEITEDIVVLELSSDSESGGEAQGVPRIVTVRRQDFKRMSRRSSLKILQTASSGLSFVEFAEALLAVALYIDPNPFVPVAIKLEKFLKSRVFRQLRDHHRALVIANATSSAAEGPAGSFGTKGLPGSIALLEVLEDQVVDKHLRESPPKPGGVSGAADVQRALAKKETPASRSQAPKPAARRRVS